MPSVVMGPCEEGHVLVINDAEDKMCVPDDISFIMWICHGTCGCSKGCWGGYSRTHERYI